MQKTNRLILSQLISIVGILSFGSCSSIAVGAAEVVADEVVEKEVVPFVEKEIKKEIEKEAEKSL